MKLRNKIAGIVRRQLEDRPGLSILKAGYVGIDVLTGRINILKMNFTELNPVFDNFRIIQLQKFVQPFIEHSKTKVIEL